jgi:hypothetical protein
VLACVNSDSYEFNLASAFVLARAEDLTSRMFATAGVALEWRTAELTACRKMQQGQTVILDFATGTRATRYPGALAYALPYERVIVVLFDRIRAQAVGPAQAPPILSHVMTHEITHILQGIVRHSETGLMKAFWDCHDFLQMTSKPLLFTAEDIGLLQRGLHSSATPPAQ